MHASVMGSRQISIRTCLNKDTNIRVQASQEFRCLWGSYIFYTFFFNVFIRSNSSISFSSFPPGYHAALQTLCCFISLHSAFFFNLRLSFPLYWCYSFHIPLLFSSSTALFRHLILLFCSCFLQPSVLHGIFFTLSFSLILSPSLSLSSSSSSHPSIPLIFHFSSLSDTIAIFLYLFLFPSLNFHSITTFRYLLLLQCLFHLHLSLYIMSSSLQLFPSLSVRFLLSTLPPLIPPSLLPYLPPLSSLRSVFTFLYIPSVFSSSPSAHTSPRFFDPKI